MRFLGEAVFLDQFVLQFFPRFAVYSHKSSALCANQMVVVLMPIPMFELVDAVTEINLSTKTGTCLVWQALFWLSGYRIFFLLLFSIFTHSSEHKSPQPEDGQRRTGCNQPEKRKKETVG